MRFLVLALSSMALAQAGNDAEKMFRTMEKKIAGSKTLQLTVDSAMESSKGKGKLTGSVLLAQGNKVRLELTGNFSGKPFAMKLVSDGTKMRAESDMVKAPAVKNTEKDLGADLSAGLSRAGVFAGLLIGRSSRPGQKAAPLDAHLKASNFALGKKEKDGERQTQVIDYVLTIGPGEKLNVQLWLDTDTQLPLKRVMSGQKGKEKVRITETYEVKVDEKVDDQKFALPK